MHAARNICNMVQPMKTRRSSLSCSRFRLDRCLGFPGRSSKRGRHPRATQRARVTGGDGGPRRGPSTARSDLTMIPAVTPSPLSSRAGAPAESVGDQTLPDLIYHLRLGTPSLVCWLQCSAAGAPGIGFLPTPPTWSLFCFQPVEVAPTTPPITFFIRTYTSWPRS